MRNTVFYILLTWLGCSCSEKKEPPQEKYLPTFTIDGQEALNITKSDYYPSLVNRPFEEVEKAEGRILVDSVDGFEIVTAKFWIADSMFKFLAEKENLTYSKTYFLDTIYENSRNDFSFSDCFEIKSASGDTAYFQLRTKGLQLTEKEIKERWKMAITCHFEDKRGMRVDTSFISSFNAQWMK